MATAKSVDHLNAHSHVVAVLEHPGGQEFPPPEGEYAGGGGVYPESGA